MSRALARKKAGAKSGSRARLHAKGSVAAVKSKSSAGSSKSSSKGAASRPAKGSGGKSRPKSADKSSKKTASKKGAGQPVVKESTAMTSGSKSRSSARLAPPPPPEKPPRLLSESKQTSAALALLEKGIKLIYQKEFKRARQELEAIASHYPGEHEIIARSRSYLQICGREEAALKKQTVTSDQLYTLGVMEHNVGNFDAAISYFVQSLEKHGSADYVHYSLAASH